MRTRLGGEIDQQTVCNRIHYLFLFPGLDHHVDGKTLMNVNFPFLGELVSKSISIVVLTFLIICKISSMESHSTVQQLPMK